MSARVGKVKCPRCGKIWIIPWGDSGIECTCHLYCSSGSEPSDCTVTYPYNYSGSLGYPVGAHLNSADEGDDVLHRGGYCSTHNKYTNKEPVWLEVDWYKWENERAPKEMRTLEKA